MTSGVPEINNLLKINHRLRTLEANHLDGTNMFKGHAIIVTEVAIDKDLASQKWRAEAARKASSICQGATR